MCEKSRYPLCQIAGCHHRAARAVEVDLPESWEATREFRTLTVVVGLCDDHGRDVAGRITQILEARSTFYNLVDVISGAVDLEWHLRRRMDRAIEQADQADLQCNGLRQQLTDCEAELRLCRALRSADQRRLAPVGGAL